MEYLYPMYSKETATRLWKEGKMLDSFYIPNYMTEKEAWEYYQEKRRKEIEAIREEKRARAEEKKLREAEKKQKKDAEKFMEKTVKDLLDGLNLDFTVKL